MRPNIDNIDNILIEAGKILEYYFANYNKVSIKAKQDFSPVTNADIEVHEFILEKLAKFGLPVVSEEDKGVEHSGNYFLLDPLDGTYQFIRRKNEFCISLALIENYKPVSGFIYAPILNEKYYSHDGDFVTNLEITNYNHLNAVISRSGDNEFSSLYKELNINDVFNFKSAIKYGRMAAGNGDINIRNFPISKWDIAAGEAMLKHLGFEFLDFEQNSINYHDPYSELNGIIAIGPKLLEHKNTILAAIKGDI